MNLHEYQSKQLFARYGIPVPTGYVAANAAEAAAAARRIGGSKWVVKAQVHAGGRGKAGGVKLVDSPEAAGKAAAAMLGTRLKTHQTGAGRSADPSGVRRGRLEDRARAVPEPGAESRQGPRGLHRLGRRRHGHRGSRRAHAGEDHPRERASGRRAAAFAVPRARVRPRARRQADRAVRQHRAGAVQACTWRRMRAWSRSIR